MRFTLTYDGVLPSKGNPEAKHQIRQVLHPQLQMLWQEPPLSQVSAWIENGNSPENGHFLTPVSGYEFASIVHPWQNLYAEIDILMLRPGAPGSIIVDGDIDNRLKTLFDALSVPNKHQIPKGWAPTTDERPLHCLLHDDQLITRVNVETAQLLNPAWIVCMYS